MGVLNLANQLAEGDVAGDDPNIELGWYDGLRDVPDQLSALDRDRQRAGRHRRNRQPTTCSKGYGLHEWKRGTGVRQQKRYDSLCSVMSMLGELSLEDAMADDIYETGMSIWGKLLEDPSKMQIWNDFISMPEEKQQGVLSNGSSVSRSKKETPKRSTKAACS